MKATVSVATNSSQSPHLASKIRKGRSTPWNSKIRAKKTGAELFRELSRLNLGGPSDDDDRKSTYAVMIGEIPKQKEEEEVDLDSFLNRCIDFGEAASKNDAVSVPVPAPTVSIPSPPVPAPVSESDVQKITASVGDSGVPPSSMDMELGMTEDDILDAILFL